jgi:integrase
VPRVRSSATQAPGPRWPGGHLGPLLFQWTYGGQHTSVSRNLIRTGINEVLERTGRTDSAGQPLDFAPHDFRRIFITDAIRSGLPPHIAQVLAGHSDINTTMGYNAIYPADAIEAHRAFIARRRSLPPTRRWPGWKMRSRRSAGKAAASAAPGSGTG